MSRVQQLRLRFEPPNEAQRPRKNTILPALERSMLKRAFQARPMAQTVQLPSITVPLPTRSIVTAPLAEADSAATVLVIPQTPLSPVKDRIKNLEGKLKVETNASFERQIQNEKLLGNRMDAVMRRQISVKERLRRKLEEAEARKRWCVVCFEEADMGEMVVAPCNHWFCNGCVKEGFKVALSSRTEFRCCKSPVPISLLPSSHSKQFVSRYSDLVLELNTPNPLYCYNSRCSAFIPPTLLFGPDVAHCVRCRAQTCRHCRDRAHTKTVCAKDESMNLAKQLRDKEGWRSCPTCKNCVERLGGCLHITCRCMTEFCYRCGGLWKDCESSCADITADET